jgi:hypothetical protein
MPISAPMVLRPSRSSVRTPPVRIESQRGDMQGGQGLLQISLSGVRGRKVRQRPGGRRSRRNRDPRGQPDSGEPRLGIADQLALTAEQMRDSGHVEPQSVAIDFDQRRPARGPAGESLDQRRVAGRVGGDGDQSRVERAGVGQASAGSRTAFRRCFGHGMDDESMRSFDGEDDGRIRR